MATPPGIGEQTQP